MRHVRTLAIPLLLVTSNAGASWELRGFFGNPRAPEVSLRDTGEGRSRWVSTGECDGEVYVESADAITGVAVVYAGRDRLVLRLAQEAPRPISDAAGDETANAGAADDGDADIASTVSRRVSGEGLRKLLLDHPEYLSANASPETRRAFAEAKARLFREADEAGLRAEAESRATRGE